MLDENERCANSLIELFQKSADLGARIAHPKDISINTGIFSVEPTIEEKYKVGIFATQTPIKCWIRFSLSFGTEKTKDTDPNARGMSIQLLKDDYSPLNQDLLFVDSPTFPIATPQIFESMIYWSQYSKLLLILIFFYKGLIGPLYNFVVGNRTKISSLSNQRFYSATPFRHGNELKAKYILIPRQCAAPQQTYKNKQDTLKYDFSYQTRHHNTLKWDIYIQPKEESDPIDDCSIKWNGPSVHIGSITVFPSNFSFQMQREMSLRLTFCLSHHWPEHEPLGSMNIVRKKVYVEMAKFRRLHSHHQELSKKESRLMYNWNKEMT